MIIDYRKEIVKSINKLSHRHNNVFEDFLEMSAISISNAVDPLQVEEREKRYLEIAKKYSKKELDSICKMFGSLVLELEKHADAPEDILGKIFHELELHNKYKGQFFTPQNVCDMIGMMAISERDLDISRKGFITVCEPCVGSGAMVFGFAKAMKKNGYNFQRQMVVTAIDIDLKCIYMAYIQLSLYGIPAVVIHGNSLTVEEWSRWYTPIYILDGWMWKTQFIDRNPIKKAECKDMPIKKNKEKSLLKEKLVQMSIFDIAE